MKLTVNLGPRSYPIVIRRGALEKAGLLANLNRKVMVVSDDGVPERYVKTLLRQCGEGHLCVLPQGEASKSPAAWQTVLQRMLAAGFGRADAVAAVGGGMAGDLAGFAAACYMRGVAFFQFPTTTLAQIDSSIGGKTALNLGGAKNVVGAFHQPSLVVADPDTLATLPPRHRANGLAEALKTALIGSGELMGIMEREDTEANIERILYLCLEYKKGVVERDETEQGERRLLNFGHTIGHGIEAACGLAGLLHGECVALGMLPMIENRVLRRRTRSVMQKLGLPLSAPCTAADILRAIPADKKRQGGSYTVVRVKAPGHGYTEQADFEEIELLVREAFA